MHTQHLFIFLLFDFIYPEFLIISPHLILACGYLWPLPRIKVLGIEQTKH